MNVFIITFILNIYCMVFEDQSFHSDCVLQVSSVGFLPPPPPPLQKKGAFWAGDKSKNFDEL